MVGNLRARVSSLPVILGELRKRAIADASNLGSWLRSLDQDLYGLIADQVPKDTRVLDGGGAAISDPPWVPVYQRTTNAG